MNPAQIKRGFNMIELVVGDVWELKGGKRVDIIDRAFIALGKRYVAVLDHDFPDMPRLLEVNRFEGAKLING